MLIHICTWSILLWDGARTPWLWWQQHALGWNGSEEAFYSAAAGVAPASLAISAAQYPRAALQCQPCQGHIWVAGHC